VGSKFIIVVIAIIILAIPFGFYATSSSYQDAMKSKFYYEISNYSKAYEFAKIAYEKDNYNKMAYTVLVQSKISMRYTNYIKQAEEYLEKITKLSKKQTVGKDELARIKLMCEIMIDDFNNLSPSKLTNQKLQDDAKNMRDKFFELKNRLF
jgi:hypothetical protein